MNVNERDYDQSSNGSGRMGGASESLESDQPEPSLTVPSESDRGITDRPFPHHVSQHAQSAPGLLEARDQGLQGLDPRHVRLETLQALIGACFLWGIAIVAGGFAWWNVPNAWVWWLSLLLTTGVLSALTVLMLWWPRIAFRHVKWKLDATGLEIRRGVFWRRCISVPLARLQHADVIQGPFQRRWGLAQLIVYTAGTQFASVALDGLSYEQAIALRDELLGQEEAADVV